MEMLTVAWLLILLGLALLIAEIFIPSGGILFVLALVALLVGVAITFTVNITIGLYTLLGVFLVLPILAVFWFYILPKTPLGRYYFLPAPSENSTLAHTADKQELEELVGRYGKTMSALRPSGITDFDGRRVDTLSEGALIGPDNWVQCIEVELGRVIVRQVDGPPNLEDIDLTQIQ